ncbi:MAG: hypothetical protein GX409_08435 [candidate division Zixibacteria bacterium]|nr:hypothetical protein [candidate division Zixibacteria bacterium]
MKLRYFLRPGVLIALLFAVASGQDTDLKNRFEVEYKAWKTYVDANSVSDLAIFNNHMRAIIQLGIPALPLIFEKMEKNEYRFDFQLEVAIPPITRKFFEIEDWPKGKRGDAITKAALFLDWWKNGIKETKNTFDRYYSARKKFLEENNTEEAEKQLNRIRNLGIVAIPYMIDKIKEGDLVFIETIAELTNQYPSKYTYSEGDSAFIGNLNELTNQGLSANASKDECLEWWSKNSSKYTIVKAE